MHTVELKHFTDTGHRIPGHENGMGKCHRLHGHSYQFDVQISSEVLDELGMVADFGAIKSVLDRWDHRTILWDQDPLRNVLDDNIRAPQTPTGYEVGIVYVPFIPTAEAMARHLAFTFLGEFDQLSFVQVDVRETAKTMARFYASQADLEAEARRRS